MIYEFKQKLFLTEAELIASVIILNQKLKHNKNRLVRVIWKIELGLENLTFILAYVGLDGATKVSFQSPECMGGLLLEKKHWAVFGNTNEC